MKTVGSGLLASCRERALVHLTLTLAGGGARGLSWVSAFIGDVLGNALVIQCFSGLKAVQRQSPRTASALQEVPVLTLPGGDWLLALRRADPEPH